MPIKECFACEKQFEFSDSFYCSEECKKEFGEALLTEIVESKKAGLSASEGDTIQQAPALSETQARSIMDQFKLKVKI